MESQPKRRDDVVGSAAWASIDNNASRMWKNAIEGRKLRLVALLDGHRQAMLGFVRNDESMQKNPSISRARSETEEHRSRGEETSSMFHSDIFCLFGPPITASELAWVPATALPMATASAMSASADRKCGSSSRGRAA